MSRKRHHKEKEHVEDEAAKTPGHIVIEKSPEQAFEDHQCSGQVENDFPTLCAILEIKDFPLVCIRQPEHSPQETVGDTDNQMKVTTYWEKPSIIVLLEPKDRFPTKSIKISGWKVSETIFRVLLKVLPSVSHLLSLRFWQAGLSDQMLIPLMNTVSLCSSLKVVMLEGNVLPKHSFHLLLSEDSPLTHLSLRNNRIGDEGARLIGSALSTPTSANKNLVSLSLAFNFIGDAGAAHIAEGLRLNRVLCFLSLSNNRIGDSGAAHLAASLREFALTHEEVVERRKLLLARMQSLQRVESEASTVDLVVPVASTTTLSVDKGPSKTKETSKKEEKQAPTKESQKSSKKISEQKTPQSKSGKGGAKEKLLSVQEDKASSIPSEVPEVVEVVNPLLDPSLSSREGKLFLHGNTTLCYINLTGNRITEKTLPLFLALLEGEGVGVGLRRVCLQRNFFPPQCECYVKILEVMSRVPEQSSPEHTLEEGQWFLC